jgi:hypothetical protein
MQGRARLAPNNGMELPVRNGTALAKEKSKAGAIFWPAAHPRRSAAAAMSGLWTRGALEVTANGR